MNTLRLLPLAGLLALCAATASAQIVVKPVSSSAATVYEPGEWTVYPGRQYENPFDPDEIAIDALFTAPDGKVLRIPAFWDQPYKSEPGRRGQQFVADGKPRWMIRFSPTMPGRWSLVVQAADKTDQRRSEAVSFTAQAGRRDGFVRRAAAAPRYFQFDSGKPFFMVGLNIGWPGRGGLTNYDDWFSSLSRAGGNFARVWMAAPNRVMETDRTGLGRYDLGVLAYYDRVFQLAEQHGIYIMLALENHRALLTSDHWGAGGWDRNPYNAAMGGPATRPIDYITNARAQKLYERRLRYLIGRYAAYTSLAFWELWNEQDLVRFEIPVSWTQQMLGYLKQHDPYGRLTTTSYAGSQQRGVCLLASNDIIQTHLYGDTGSIIDFPQKITSQLKKWDAIPKPQLLGEFGIDWRGPDDKYDPTGTGINLHNGIWSPVFAGAAGSGCTWWWDSYVAPKNLWHQFTPLAKFAATIDWTHRDFRPVAAPVCSLAPGERETYEDLVLHALGGWEKGSSRPMTLNADGTISGGQLPQFLFGPIKKDMRARLNLKLTLARPTRVTIRVKDVSAHALLRASIDDKPVANWAFDAQPGSAELKSTRTQPPGSKYYIGTFDVDRPLEVPAGEHTLSLENAEGDWVRIESITLAGAMPIEHRIRRHLLSDAASGQVIGWLHDSASGWKSATEPPHTFNGLTLAVPVPRDGSYTVRWWDTFTGKVIRTDALETRDGKLGVTIPPLTRDIAFDVVWKK